MHEFAVDAASRARLPNVRGRMPRLLGAAAGRLQRGVPAGVLRLHRDRRVATARFTTSGGSARILRRLLDRPDRHADGKRPGSSSKTSCRITTRSGPSPTVSTSASRSMHRNRGDQAGGDAQEGTGAAHPAARPSSLRKKQAELEIDLTYTAGQLDRDVVNRDRSGLWSARFVTGCRRSSPAARRSQDADLRQDRLACGGRVEIVRTEFDKGNDFCQKITRQGRRPGDGAEAVPERVPAAGGRHRGHDRHRDGREAARMPAVPPGREVALVFRADEGPRVPDRVAGRDGEGEPGGRPRRIS